MTIDKTLAEREKTYGNFEDKAFFIQMIKETMRHQEGWDYLDADMQEALDMISSKIGRIIIGDADHIDNWHDISGYAQLIEQRLITAPTRKPTPKRN